MKDIAQATQGRRWVAIETQDEADRETALMRHAVKHFFWQSARLPEVDRPRFLSLRDADGAPLSTCMVCAGRIEVAVAGANASPWPRFEADYRALADAIGCMLDPVGDYPYASRGPAESDESAPGPCVR